MRIGRTALISDDSKFVGLLAFLAVVALLVVLLGSSFKIRARTPNILFILVDTLRPDHLGCYGYNRDTSPYMDGIASNGVRFSNFYSVSSWTNPAIVSLFTGEYPQAVFPAEGYGRAVERILPEATPTLAEILKENGYYTAALVEHAAIGKSRFAGGFETFIELHREPVDDSVSEWPVGPAKTVMAKLPNVLGAAKEKPFYVYLHVIYPHIPYDAPPPYDTMFGPSYNSLSPSQRARAINSYDGEIRYTDQLIGNIFSELQSRDLLDDTYVFITSDHGEEFLDHDGWEHGHTLFNELLRVPLIIHPPMHAVVQKPLVDEPGSVIDLFPTILDLAGVEIPERYPGRSLIPCFSGGCPERRGMPFFSESQHTGDIAAQSVMLNGMKYIYSPALERKKLFALDADPGETRNLFAAEPSLADELDGVLAIHREGSERRRSHVSNSSAPLSNDAVNKLRSLGYLGGK